MAATRVETEVEHTSLWEAIVRAGSLARI